jgi:hypothetical protein
MALSDAPRPAACQSERVQRIARLLEDQRGMDEQIEASLNNFG